MSDICEDLHNRAQDLMRTGDHLSSHLMESATQYLQIYRDKEIPELQAEISRLKIERDGLAGMLQKHVGSSYPAEYEHAMARVEVMRKLCSQAKDFYSQYRFLTTSGEQTNEQLQREAEFKSAITDWLCLEDKGK